MDRRNFNALLSGAVSTALIGSAARAAPPAGRTALYASAGPRLTHYAVDVAGASLTPRATLTLPSGVQYAWPHPSRPFLYVAVSDAGPGGRPPPGSSHWLCALRIGADGALSPHGEARPLPSRPINNSVDGAGDYALTCYNDPPGLTVHPILADGTLGPPVQQAAGLDLGVYPHQIRSLPANRSAAVVTRGNPPSATQPGSQGALKLFGFSRGQLSPLADIALGHGAGNSYGPRHLDFHPARPWAYVAVETQNQLHMHGLRGEGLEPTPAHVLPTTAAPPPAGRNQVAGAIHVHPRGHAVYVANRASGSVDFGGRRVFAGGENTIAVFALDPATGEPRPIQHIDVQGIHARTFSIDPSGRLLIAAHAQAMPVREGDQVRTVPAGLSLFRIADDGRLSFVRKYDVELGADQQLWAGLVPLRG